jgi:hypothetical protein
MSRSEPPDEVKRRLPHDPRLWARNYLRHPNDPGRPYDFWDDLGPPPEDEDPEDWEGEFLWYLADDDGPMNPEKWGDINILLFCRGGLKTFTVSTINAWAADMFPTIEAVATAPRDDQREEVIDRFKQKVEQSGMADRRVKDNLGHQKFRNTAVDSETGETYPAYSHLKSRSAWNEGDALRGLHGHIGDIDEAQDVDEGTFSTFLEAIDRSVPQVDYFPTIFVIGTPKMANSFFHKLWKMSDKKSWDQDAKEWAQQDEPTEFLPEELAARQQELDERIEELEAERHTASENGNGDRVEELTELIESFEEERDGIEGFTVRGWHLDQHNSPIHSDTDIAFKKETYSKKKFKNEVEAQFYSPEHDLITNDDVHDAFVERRMASAQNHPETETFLGVDWGGGQGEGAAQTVITVAELAPDGETLSVLDMDIVDSDLSSKQERERIDDKMQRFDVDIAVVDEGFGNTDRETLQDDFGYDDSGDQRLYGCWYGNVKDVEEVKWNRFNNSRRFFTASKVFCVEQMAEDFKSGKIEIPSEGLSFDSKQSKGTKVLDQLTAPYTERKEHEGGKKKKIIKSDRNDDVFDSLTYVWIAANKVRSKRSIKEIGTHTRPGY